MGEWVGGWVGWGDLGCFLLMDLPPSGWGHGPSLFPHLLSPSSPSLMHFRATRCIYVYCEIGMLSRVHGDTFYVPAAEHQFLPLVSSYLFCYLLWS